MGKCKILNESIIIDLKMSEGGEIFGSMINLLGGENLLIKYKEGLLDEEE